VTVLDRDDIQGNVLRGYNFPCARYLVARVRDGPAAAEAARRWLAEQADPVMSDAEWTETPRLAGNIALSWAGLRALRLPGWLLASFPADFRDGMAARAGLIGDTGAAGPDRWEAGLRPGDIHVLVTLQGCDPGALGRTAGRVRREMTANGFDPGVEQKAARLGDDREHFGFTDGFGQPAVAGVVRHGIPGQGVPIRRRRRPRRRADVVPSGVDPGLAWRALRAGEFVLGYPDEDGGLPPAPAAPLDRNGTFMVWRKLRQDVAGFRAWVAEAAAETGYGPDLIAAKVIGRWPDGSPLILRPRYGDAELGNDRRRVNDFAYGDDPEGLACPRGAHVRRANPRDAFRAGGRLTARHRIIRRGMPYGPPLAPDADADGEDRGLVFVALQASIERQFEIVQARWLNDGDAFGLGRTPDPVAGAVTCPARQSFGGRPPVYATALRSFVTLRGGEYLFVPALSGLRALARL
jgi:Dyp-type peroxidase family